MPARELAKAGAFAGTCEDGYYLRRRGVFHRKNCSLENHKLNDVGGP